MFDAINGLDRFQYVLNRIPQRIFSCFQCQAFVSHVLQGNYLLTDLFLCQLLRAMVLFFNDKGSRRIRSHNNWKDIEGRTLQYGCRKTYVWFPVPAGKCVLLDPVGRIPAVMLPHDGTVLWIEQLCQSVALSGHDCFCCCEHTPRYPVSLDGLWILLLFRICFIHVC